MKTIELVHYRAQLKQRLQLHLGTDGSYGIERLRIQPGAGWEDMVITATFHAPSGAAVQLLVPENGEIDVPPEATSMGGRDARGSIVFCGTKEGVQRVSCDMPYLVEVHSGVEGDASRQPTPSFVEQALGEIRTACQAVEEAEERISQMAGSAPVKTSQLINDSGFITAAVRDLEHYYRSSLLYTKEEVDQRISAIPKFRIEVVEQLPTADMAEQTVYLVPGTAQEKNLYTEYLYVNGAWERLGSQTMDLSGYALRSELESVDAAKLGGFLPAHYASRSYAAGLTACNLLDNSDFTRPVNQRGQTTYTASGYTIDRWISLSSYLTITVTANGLQIKNNYTAIVYPEQRLEKGIIKADTVYTVACWFADGTVAVQTIQPQNGVMTGTNLWHNGVSFSLGMDKANYDRFTIFVEAGNTAEITKVALYEGEYTEDTLPPYRYKGEAAEWCACMRYYRRYAELGSAVGSGFMVSGGTAAVVSISTLPMRAVPVASGRVHLAVPAALTDTAPVSSSFTAVGGKSGAVWVTCTLAAADGSKAGQPVVLALRSGDRLELSAEL